MISCGCLWWTCVGVVDDIAYDAKLKRVYLSGDAFVEVVKQDDVDQYTSLGKVPSGFRAKTAIFVPELNRYYLAEPRHGGVTGRSQSLRTRSLSMLAADC